MKLAVIPARGGGKRIPRKNIRPFAGQPMISWSIRATIESRCFDRIIVSTDDEDIAQVARDHGAEVPFLRPPELSDRSQDLEEAWHDAGQFYWGRAECWLAQDALFGPRSAPGSLVPLPGSGHRYVRRLGTRRMDVPRYEPGRGVTCN